MGWRAISPPESWLGFLPVRVEQVKDGYPEYGGKSRGQLHARPRAILQARYDALRRSNGCRKVNLRHLLCLAY